MSIEKIFEKVADLSSVKLFKKAVSFNNNNESRQTLQKLISEEAKKNSVPISNDAPSNKTNAENRIRSLANEGLAHTCRLAKVELARERLKNLKEYSVDEAIKVLERMQTAREQDGKIARYNRYYRTRDFQDITNRIINKDDGRRIDELELANKEQAKLMQEPLIVDNKKSTVGDYLADERLISALAHHKGKKVKDVISNIEMELGEESKKINQRTLRIAAQILGLKD